MKKKVIKLSIVISILIILLKILPSFILTNIKYEKIKNAKLVASNSEIITKQEQGYNIVDLAKYLYDSSSENITIVSDNNIEYTCNCDNSFTIKIDNKKENTNYSVKYKISGKEYTETLNSNENPINFHLMQEGKNKVNVKVLRNDENIYEYDTEISYIKPYEKQYLEETTNKGIMLHIKHPYGTDMEKTIELLNAIGIKNVRIDIAWSFIVENNEQYGIDMYDKWISRLDSEGIKIVAVLAYPNANMVSNGKTISNDKEIEKFLSYVNLVSNRYQQIKKFEIWNEPNLNQYLSDAEIQLYSKMVNQAYNIIKKNNKEAEIYAGATYTPANNSSEYIKSDEFFQKIINNGSYINSNVFSFHPYENSKGLNNNWIKKQNQIHKELANSNGGFQKLAVTEYGVSTATTYYSQEEQANKMVQQTVFQEQYNLESQILYNFKDYTPDKDKLSSNYGLIDTSYIPKLSYYAMKKYYENTNGAEYIGNVNFTDGLEMHIYDKDGKQKIVAWATNVDRPVTLSVGNSLITDIYGKELQKTNGNVIITNTPVYIDNLNTNYYYKAISNVATQKYNDFINQFHDILDTNHIMKSIKSKAIALDTYMQEIGNDSKISQDTAVSRMQEHYNIGNDILKAYKSGELKVDDKTVSSMLDMLEDIGSSFEDLVTVTVTKENANLEVTKEILSFTENMITCNSDLNIIYPEKILQYAKENYEKAEYIKNLQEENPIRMGLIVSRNLHANELGKWAKEFSEIYIHNYIEVNPYSVRYSTKDITNQNVTVTLQLGEDSEMTNHNGKNQYTFEENGEFTFQYIRRGQACEEKVRVDWIDKTAPSITGVENGKTYQEEVIPVIKDENLLEIKVTVNGKEITYTENMKLEEEGFYTIRASDKAGNITNINFVILSKDSDQYIIGDAQITNVFKLTTVDKLKEKLNLVGQAQVYRNGKVVEKSKIVATGDILKNEKGEEYTLIVRGDILKEGENSIRDLVRLRRYLVQDIELDELSLKAADTNLDGIVDIKDIVRMRILILQEP